jgi:hypothetical protein
VKDFISAQNILGRLRPSEAFQRYHLISTLLMVGYLEILQASGDVCDEDFDFENEALLVDFYILVYSNHIDPDKRSI